MTEALVENDPGRIHPDDMAAIVAALDGIDVSAQPTREHPAESPEAWTLCLHWLQKGPVSSDTEAALPAVLTRIREHYTTHGRTPPAQLDLHGPDGGVVLSLGAG
ncbi:hypothetical protein ACEZDB_08260 [Streptacidiphilus sp. N1-3]|uniref:Uncharacterized protein n=1 Tax=Streptacidiphilus alkalitolerans TaxID=3342712 RepID=A0ABV6WX90_9ACTN